MWLRRLGVRLGHVQLRSLGRRVGVCGSRRMQRVSVVLLAFALAACGADAAPTRSIEDRYLDPDEVAFRRAELVASLVNPSNAYSQLRLAHYATNGVDDWDRAPEWNPAAENV